MFCLYSLPPPLTTPISILPLTAARVLLQKKQKPGDKPHALTSKSKSLLRHKYVARPGSCSLLQLNFALPSSLASHHTGFPPRRAGDAPFSSLSPQARSPGSSTLCLEFFSFSRPLFHPSNPHSSMLCFLGSLFYLAPCHILTSTWSGLLVYILL